MKVQVLISTMYQENYDLLKKMNINSNAIVINQCNKDSYKEFYYKKYHIIWINTKERGLSKSRNYALSKASADICLIADDDLIYKDDYVKIITEEFLKNPSMDIITFSIQGIESEFKKYSKKEKKINLMNSMKISSVEIAFKLNKIKNRGIIFNELFGSGAKYYMGEEGIFLIKCLKRGLNIKSVPKYIADLHLGESTWFEGYNELYFINKGAAFTAMFDKIAIIIIWQFAIRKKNLYDDKFSVFKVISLMKQGKKEFLKEKKRSFIN